LVYRLASDGQLAATQEQVPEPSTVTIPDSNSVILDGDESWSEFNQTPFAFAHTLSEHPLLDLASLRSVAIEFVANGGPGKVSVFDGNKGRNAKWADWDLDGSRVDLVASAFEHLHEEGRTLVVIQDVEREPRYGKLLRQVLAEITARIPEYLRDEITWPSAYLFIAAPGFYTPYHLDHEVGLLLQIHGDKELYVYDDKDRAILTEEQLEQYYVGDLDAASLPEDKADAGRRFDLVPGTASHFPAHAPHWVRNKGDYSISLSINFCLRSLDRAAKVWQANHFLRKLGARPTPPGRSRVADYVKRGILELISQRHPATKGEMLRSGVERLYRVAAFGKSAMRSHPKRRTHRPHAHN
jgi:hypothetical protein